MHITEIVFAINAHVSAEGTGSNNDRFLGRSVRSGLPNSVNPKLDTEKLVHKRILKKNITVSNRSSHLSVAPRLHWAYVYATGYSPRTQEEDVRRDLEANLERRIGKRCCVIVEKLTSKYKPHTTYSSFRVSVRIYKSKVLLESSL